MKTLDMDRRLASSEGFDATFELVRRAVESSTGLHRAGLALVLGELPNYIGAYHVLGSNSIVMNRTLLEAVKRLAKSKVEFNSYVFSILLHEYLHSLGFTEERVVRPLVLRVTRENLGEGHTAVDMASRSLFDIYPELRYLGLGRQGADFELIKEFDKRSWPYIG